MYAVHCRMAVVNWGDALHVMTKTKTCSALDLMAAVVSCDARFQTKKIVTVVRIYKYSITVLIVLEVAVAPVTLWQVYYDIWYMIYYTVPGMISRLRNWGIPSIFSTTYDNKKTCRPFIVTRPQPQQPDFGCFVLLSVCLLFVFCLLEVFCFSLFIFLSFLLLCLRVLPACLRVAAARSCVP